MTTHLAKQYVPKPEQAVIEWLLDADPSIRWIVVDDANGLPPSHPAEFFALLGGGRRDGSWDRSGMSKSQLFFIRLLC